MTVFDFIERFILFVVPGFVGYSLFCYLTGKRQSSELFSIAYIFIISILSFLGGNLIIFLINHFSTIQLSVVNVAQILSGDKQSLTTMGICSAISTSIIIGFLAVGVHDHKILFRIANLIKLTHRVDNADVWSYLFDSQPWVVVRDYITGNTYYGRVVRYSDSDESKLREILLDEVTVTLPNSGEYKMNRVYISRNPSEFSIEIDNYAKEAEQHAKTRETVTSSAK